jgi:diadenosine tetraphosphatase ApaH/serine/threonine PP2A family protein phosphatase
MCLAPCGRGRYLAPVSPLRRAPSLGLSALALVLCACPAAEGEPVRFVHLTQMSPRPDRRVGVYLNEPLEFNFSADVDPSSVTMESILVRDVVSGAPASGYFEVTGRQVVFLPTLGRERDLSDGGLRPGTRYEILIRGFPVLDGLRSVEGWPLAASGLFHLETAQVTEPRGQMFEDNTPESGDPLYTAPGPYSGEESLLVRCDEPLDPSTLVDGEFVLIPQRASDESIPLDLRLVSNSRDGGAELELRPRRLLAPGVYRLTTPVGTSIRDFSGNPVWYSPRPGQEPQVEISEQGEERPALDMTFLSDVMRSRHVVEDVDGTAHWNDSGLVTVRFPLSAGNGADGDVRLAGAESRRDVHATSMDLGAGEEAQLLSVPGLVVLRTQGKLRIDGTLRRRAGPAEDSIDGSYDRGDGLSAWLGSAQVADSNWTVLVAGGDLVVEGEIDVDGPLLLAAGGRIRVTGRLRAQHDELWLVGGGGSGSQNQPASSADLVLDPPYDNPLVGQLRYAVLSTYLPSSGGVVRWAEPEVHAEERGGTYEISYLPADLPVDRPLTEWGAVNSPRDLLEADRLRVLVILTVGPSTGRTRWNPPVVDDVQLVWEPERR